MLVMAKAPRAGQVKTRLEPLLGPEGSARLQAALIEQAAAFALRVAPSGAYLSFAPAGAAAELGELVPAAMTLFPQADGDLGERLAEATGRVLRERPGPLIVIGTDLPTLGPSHTDSAVERLREGCDVVFGPAEDGGYYLVAIERPQPEVFALGAALWGGAEVLEASVRAAEAAGLRVGLLGPERDLDTPADVRAALRERSLPPRLAALLEEPALRFPGA